jgi:hypothetical protein
LCIDNHTQTHQRNQIQTALLKAYFTPQPAEFATSFVFHFDFGTNENMALNCPSIDVLALSQ